MPSSLPISMLPEGHPADANSLGVGVPSIVTRSLKLSHDRIANEEGTH